jgi:type I restriction enzyme, S subunit
MSEPIPACWRKAALAELVHERTDRVGRHQKPIVLSSTKHQGLVPSDVYFRGRTIYSEDLSNYKQVRRNWFAYATNHLAEGSIGLQQDFDAACVSPIYTVFECGELVDPDFLHRILKSPSLIAEYSLHEQASVDRRGAVRFRDFAKIDIRLPLLLTEQRRIAELLDSADDVIQSTELYVNKLELSWRGVLSRLLTCGVDQGGAVRSNGQEPGEFTLTSLGHIPHIWRVLPLGELAHYVNGYAFKPEDWGETGLPIIRIQNINGSTDFNFFEGPIDPSVLVDAGDLLFAWSGTRDSSFGPTVWEGPRGLLNQHIFRVQEKRSIVDRSFLCLLLRYNLERIASSAHGFKDSFVHVKRSDLTSVAVAVPDLEEQKRIVLIAQAEQSLVDAEHLKLESLRRLREGLASDLLTGRVRTGDWSA